MKPIRWMFVAAISSLLLAGCGGGGGGVKDTTAPAVTGLTVVRTAGNTPHVTVNVVDDLTGVSSVTAVVEDATAGAAPVRVPLAPVAGSEGGYAGDLNSTAVAVKVEAKDTAGNTTVTDQVKVPPPDPGL